VIEPGAPIGDDDLHAYVDGRLDEVRRKQVSLHLAAHPGLRQRVLDWEAQAAALRRALRPDDASERAAILARLGAKRDGRSRGQLASRAAIAATVTASMLIGGATGWTLHGDSNPTEIARLGIEAASAYRVFAHDPVRPVEISSDNPVELAGWMAQKLGWRISLPDLAPMGFHLLGGRVLTAMYGPAAMLVYRDKSDNRMIIYIQPMKIGVAAPMRPVESQAVGGYAWIEHQVGYTVMSERNGSRLHSLANHVRAETRS
jgi:anti-sigma factor RsiW